MLGGKTAAGYNESDIPVGESDREAGPDADPLPRANHDVVRRCQVCPCITRMRDEWNRARDHENFDVVSHVTRVDQNAWSNGGVTDYTEVLRPSFGVYLIVALVLPILTLTFAPFSLPLGIGVSVVVFAAICVLLFTLSPRIVVTSTTLRAGRAVIERRYIGAVSAFSGDAARAERGVNLNATAWTLFRGYIDPVVKIEITDEQDPTPYWLVSSRRPLELATVLRASPHRKSGKGTKP